MALDFGGLDYTINVRDKFSSNVAAFRAGIEGARADFRKLKRELGLPIKGGAQRELARASREQTKALREEASAIRTVNKDRRNAVRVLSLSRAAKIRLGRETRKLAVAQAAANLEIKRNLVNSRQLLTTDQRRIRAEKDIAAVLDRRGRSEAVLNAARERGVTLTTEELRKLKLLTVEQEKLFLAKKKLKEQEAIAGNKVLRTITAETAALKKQNQILQQQANLKAITRRGLTPIGGAGAPVGVVPTAPTRPISPAAENQTFRDRIRNFLQLDKSQKKAAESANRFSFTFRRLIGILAAFTIVRLIVRGFTDLVQQLILFNANIEQSTLGIAALFTAVGDVRDATGEAAESSQALAIAQKEARRQTQLLRRDALATAATFDKLLETFQVAVAPGLAAGLDIDEIREFTIRISQAASAIGLQQNQLAEEIRSILAGTIQARTTRIAVALGITNEDIRLAKEAGVLTQFLNERFIAFKEAGIEALKTFNALLTNTRDAILLLFEEGGLEFFEELKGLLADIQALIVQTDIGEALVPDPRAVAVVRAIADGLRDAAAQVRALISEEGLGGLLGLATLIGGTISVISAVLGPVIAGILAGLNDIQNGFSALRELILSLGLDQIFGGDILKEAVKQIARFATSFGVVAVIGITVLAIIKGIAAAALLLPGILSSSAGILAITVLAAGFLIAKFKELVEEIIGARLGFTQFLKLIFFSVATSFARAFNAIKTGFLNLFSGFRIIILQVTSFLADKFLGAVAGVLTVLSTVSDTAADALKEVKQLQKDINAGLAEEIRLSREAIRIRKAAAAIEDRRLLANLDEIAKDLVKETNKEAIKLAISLDKIPGIISRARTPLLSQGKLVKELADDAQKAADALKFAGIATGLSGAVLEQRKIQFDSIIALRDKGLILTVQQQEAEKELRNIQRDRILNNRKINDLNERTQELVTEAVQSVKAVLAAEREVAEAKSSSVLAELRLKVASKEGKEAAEAVLGIAKSREALSRRRLSDLKKEQEAIEDNLTAEIETEEAAKELTKTIQDRVALTGRERVIQERLLAITKDRVDLERRLAEAANLRIRRVGEAAIRETIDTNARADQELRNRRRELAARELPDVQREQIQITGEIEAAQLELRLAERDAELELRSLENSRILLQLQQETFLLANAELTTEEQIAKVREGIIIFERIISEEKKKQGGGDRKRIEDLQQLIDDEKALLSTLETIAVVEKQIELASVDDIALVESLNLKLEELKATLKDLAETKGVGTPIQQFSQAIDDAEKRLLTFQKDTIVKFADFASQVIVDAFDPTKDVNLKQRFAQFLQGIARQIIALTIQIAILRAFGGIGTPAGAAGGPVAQIPRFFKRGGRVSPWAHARGFEGGGVPNKPASASVRPPHLPPTDKVPIWTTFGEWVIRRASVAKYGNNVMSAINRGLVDPTALKSLAGIGGRHTSRSSRTPGFQEGGLVSETLAAQRDAEEDIGEEAPGMQVLPVLVADRTSMQRLIDGGGEVLLDFLRENQDTINSQDGTRT